MVAAMLPPAPAYMLPGVKLFASGVYRGRRWTPATVRAMAQTAAALAPLITPPAVLGHEEEQEWLDRTDLPAAGWIDPASVRAVPDPAHPGEAILVGDVVNVPAEVAERLAAGEYAHCSAEIYDDFRDDMGAAHGPALRRLALLGGEVPQVKRLGRLPAPVPMQSVRVFAEVAKQPRRPTGQTFVITFAERTVMDRTEAYAAIAAAMPNLSQATLDALTDDQIKELVAALPAAPAPATPAADPNAPPAMMDDAAVPVEAAAAPAMTREEMVAALVAEGQDQATLDAMDDAALKQLYDEVMAAKAPPAAVAEVPAAPAMMGERAKHKVARALDAGAKAVARLTRMSERAARAEKKAEVEPVCRDLVRAGFTPAFVDGWIRPQLERLDNEHALIRFSEGGRTKTGTALQAKLAAARQLDPKKCFVAFGEKTGGPAPSSGAEEEQKVARFAETLSDTVIRAGGYKDRAGFVQKFSEARKKNPALTAADYLGTGAAR